MKKFLTIVFILVSLPSLIFSQSKSSKKGIAYGNLSEADIAVISGGISWFYNWYLEPNAAAKNVYQDYNMDFVPMVWGQDKDTALLRTFLKTHPDVKYLLGFNEPNFTSQSNMTPAQAAKKWPMIEKIADDFGLKIVGPAVNYCYPCVNIPGTNNDSDPVVYLDSFFLDCPGCRVDYIAIHNYMCYTSALAGYINRFKKYGKPIWLTEFACWDQSNITLDMQKNLVVGAIELMEKDTMVYRYSWFTGDRSGATPYLDLFAPQAGKLTELGELYTNFYPGHDTGIYTPVPARIEAEDYNIMKGVTFEPVKDWDGLVDVIVQSPHDSLEYNIDVPDTANYYIYLRIAGNTASSIDFRVNNSTLGTLAVPAAGGSQNWTTISKELSLNKGKQKLTLYTPTGVFNLNWIIISKRANTPPSSANAGIDQTLIIPANSTRLIGTVSDPDGDTLQYKWKVIGGPSFPTFDNDANDTVNISGLKEGTYTFTFTVFDGFATATDQVIVKVMKPVNIQGNMNEENIVFPNPVEDKLYIKSEVLTLETTVSVIDQTGRLIQNKVFEPGTNSMELDFSRIGNGFYLIRIRNSASSSTYSVVK
jgi:hypothetical protein